jgi:hypothetical protein
MNEDTLVIRRDRAAHHVDAEVRAKAFAALLDSVRAYLVGQSDQSIDMLDEVEVMVLLNEALHHKLAPLVAGRLRRHPGLSQPLRIHVTELQMLAGHRLNVFVRHALHTQRLLHAHDIKVLFRKGVVLSVSLYRSPSDRHCSDIDLYCAARDREVARRVLLDAGLQEGELNNDRRHRPHSRSEAFFTKLYPDHLPRLIIETADPLLPSVQVDVSVDIGWSGAPLSDARHAFLVRELENTATDANGLGTASTAWFHFIDVALHLYRDAYFEMNIDKGVDVHLSKFLDLALLWRQMSEQIPEFQRTVDELGAADAMAWVTHHCDEVLGTRISRALGLDRRVHEGLVRPNTWQGLDGQVRPWEGTMTDRLRRKSSPGDDIRQGGIHHPGVVR